MQKNSQKKTEAKPGIVDPFFFKSEGESNKSSSRLSGIRGGRSLRLKRC